MSHVLILVLAILPSVFSASKSTNTLFQNTIKRWNIDISSTSDRRERWKRFVGAKETVERTSRSAASLDSLSLFTVLNDEEYETKVGPLRRRLKRSAAANESSLIDLFISDSLETAGLAKRGYTDTVLPETFNYWEDDVGLNEPSDQFGCGSCWSFPTVATMEALYKEQTGETVAFSQQYFVDCSFEGDGCGGGAINDGYKLTVMRQYMMSRADWPYTADYNECAFADDIASFNNNALKKLWVTTWAGLSHNENGMLSGLLHSPVAFGSYVSNDIFDYSGGPWTDSSCSSDPNAHAMLLVGYTESTLRVQNSYGPYWGDGGYADYERGTVTLDSCRFYTSAFFITTTYRRELQYEWCNDKRMSTRNECSDSCEAMNTDTETGWTLAVIPTRYHNTLVVDMINAEYPGVKSDDKFNYLWIGITDIDKVGYYVWADDYTPVQYQNITENVAKYGMINKNTGYWAFKNSLTYTARGICSRTVNCWDIGTAVENGEVTFDNEALTEGTVASVTCSRGYMVEGAATLTCIAGIWSEDLPSCEIAQCAIPQLQNGGVSPNHTIGEGEAFSYSCDEGYILRGDPSSECTHDGTLSNIVPSCPVACSIPQLENGVVSPDRIIGEGDIFDFSCNDGYILNGNSSSQCTKNGTLSNSVPVCLEAISVTAQLTEVSCDFGDKCWVYCDVTLGSGEEADKDFLKMCKYKTDGSGDWNSCKNTKANVNGFRKKISAKKTSASGDYVCVYYDEDGEVAAHSEPITFTVVETEVVESEMDEEEVVEEEEVDAV